MINYKELSEIKERESKATKGPWGIEPGTYGNRITFLDCNYDYPEEKYTAYLGIRDKLSDSFNVWNQDAKFIAHSREDIPRLIEALERSVYLIKKLESGLTANLEMMECRADEDCDHCVLSNYNDKARDFLKQLEGEE